jgi:adenylate cyclase
MRGAPPSSQLIGDAWAHPGLFATISLSLRADGSHLWSERYDRQIEDVFAIQDEIALAIVDNLKVTLLRHSSFRISPVDTFLTRAGW